MKAILLDEKTVDDLTKIVFFLLWAENQNPRMMFGGHSITDVIQSVANIMKMEPAALREWVK